MILIFFILISQLFDSFCSFRPFFGYFSCNSWLDKIEGLRFETISSQKPLDLLINSLRIFIVGYSEKLVKLVFNFDLNDESMTVRFWWIRLQLLIERLGHLWKHNFLVLLLLFIQTDIPQLLKFVNNQRTLFSSIIFRIFKIVNLWIS